jgi:hypothetical protein
MNAAVVTGDRTGKKGLGLARGGVLLGVLAALGLLLAPSNASAQITPISNASDYCASSSPLGRFPAQKPFGTITVNAPAGAVRVEMWNTIADCVQQTGTNTWRIQTVCEFHCSHEHTAPYPWTVAIIPQAASFQGWSGANCEPIKAAPKSYCIVRMTTDHAVTANFGSSADNLPPTPPVVTAAPQPYAVTLSWTPSADTSPAGGSWLAGYDIHASPVRVPHVARVTASTTSFRVTNLLCATTYTFRVEGFDWSGNTTSSAPITATTGACTTGGGGGLLRPNTAIHVKPPKVTRKRTAYFHFGAAGETAATKFQCKLNRNRWVRCSGTAGKTYRRLARGRSHTFRVRAGNAAGWDPTPARYTWRIRR